MSKTMELINKNNNYSLKSYQILNNNSNNININTNNTNMSINSINDILHGNIINYNKRFNERISKNKYKTLINIRHFSSSSNIILQ